MNDALKFEIALLAVLFAAVIAPWVLLAGHLLGWL
jgi:hypothetical protein